MKHIGQSPKKKNQGLKFKWRTKPRIELHKYTSHTIGQKKQIIGWIYWAYFAKTKVYPLKSTALAVEMAEREIEAETVVSLWLIGLSNTVVGSQ